jgi:hypothetical protein
MHSTSNLEDGYLGSGKRLWYSIRKHGKENHFIEILEWFSSRSALRDREKELVNSDLLKDHHCMNLKEGGEGGLSTPEHREKFQRTGALKFKEKMKDPVYREKFCQKVSENNRARKGKMTLKNEHCKGTCWITDGTSNKQIKIEKVEEFLQDGWRKGKTVRKDAKWNPWNKGKSSSDMNQTSV